MQDAQGIARDQRTKAISDMVATKLLGAPLVVNHMRGIVAEAIVAQALGPDWRWCSEDWGGWDFVRHDGLKLEVKQSAARQTWAAEHARPSPAIFDIALRKGRYAEQSAWIEQAGRWADLHVFAHHPLADAAADHRDPEQWIFHVVLTSALPAQATIALGRVRQLAEGCAHRDLREAIDRVALTLHDQR